MNPLLVKANVTSSSTRLILPEVFAVLDSTSHELSYYVRIANAKLSGSRFMYSIIESHSIYLALIGVWLMIPVR